MIVEETGAGEVCTLVCCLSPFLIYYTAYISD